MWNILWFVNECFNLVQSFAGYLSMEIGNRKGLVCSCGLLTRLCSAFIRFGEALSRFRAALPCIWWYLPQLLNYASGLTSNLQSSVMVQTNDLKNWRVSVFAKCIWVWFKWRGWTLCAMGMSSRQVNDTSAWWELGQMIDLWLKKHTMAMYTIAIGI